ncbi:uncharacterized protein [Rutidosis leptorrhynchoides]|uniref:uncharacterized protein n=1 Tax=Rutidosis leptorrhynchoides TaxID=125765 RepID=UPI003A99641F
MEKLSYFIQVAEDDRVNRHKTIIHCPCRKCRNGQCFSDSTIIRNHLLVNRFTRGYTCWSFHGESLVDSNPRVPYCNDTNDDVNDYVDDDVNVEESYNGDEDNFDDMLHDLEDNVAEKYHDKFQQLFVDSEKPLYNGCTNFTKLSAVVKLVNLKANNGWSDTSFTSLLELLHKMLPEDNELPVSTYKAKKLMCPMGLEIQRIHACPNDCMLYRNEDENLHKCRVCGTSRYKHGKPANVDSDVTENGPPAKLLWYLPIIPRLKRLFANVKDAKLLRWHAEERKRDGKIRHVADSLQWRNIDNDFEEFGDEIRNIRFGLSLDGFNPFGDLSSRYSTWPVLLCIYNLPSWLCMKRKYIMMSLLIQGPKQPGNDIDVYLEPLIDDMMQLWHTGVEVYDAYKKEYFQLRAMIFCTINDFPAYGNLSGYSTKGKKACPVCGDDTCSLWLKNCKKLVFMGHRRSLSKRHPYRKKKKLFDGKVEVRVLGPPLDGETIFSKIADIDVVLGKKGTPPKGIWKKKSIFWKLPYWKHLHVRHCLDVMHIEKNVCESLIGLLLNIPGKTKDGLNVREDMVLMKIRPELAPQDIDGRRTKFLPPACYTMSKVEKTKFCQSLHGIKVPSGYSANIKKLVSLKDLKLIGMKSHDCHVLMTQMIPIAIRGILPDHIRRTITKLCLFFNRIHSKVIDPEELDEYQQDIILTLCELEMYFPPSFFDVMVHLISHIVGEIKACGPVFLRYMYPFERYTSILKGYVRNHNRPEGSIVEGYAYEEVIEFCTDYMNGYRSIGIPQSRHKGRLTGQGTLGRKRDVSNVNDLRDAHFTVLQHTTCIDPYIQEHQLLLRNKYSQKSSSWLAKEHNRTFSDWLKNEVRSTLPNVEKTVEELGFGPKHVIRYQGYDINGYTFYTKEQDEKSTVQNSGVTVIERTLIASSTEVTTVNREERLRIAKNSYYGVIQEIWELNNGSFVIPLFKCMWVDNEKGVRVDADGFTTVNLSSSGYASEPFILSKLVTQVFYVEDPNDSRWHVVQHGKRRIVGVDNVVDEEEYDQFDELPPFSVGIESRKEVLNDIDVLYFRDDHHEGDEAGFWPEQWQIVDNVVVAKRSPDTVMKHSEALSHTNLDECKDQVILCLCIIGTIRDIAGRHAALIATKMGSFTHFHKECLTKTPPSPQKQKNWRTFSIFYLQPPTPQVNPPPTAAANHQLPSGGASSNY